MRLALAVVLAGSCGPDLLPPVSDGGLDGGIDLAPDGGTLLTLPLPVVPLDEKYLAESWGSCSRESHLTGFQPNTNGVKYPLFLYFVGTLDNWGYSSSFPYDPSKPNPVLLAMMRDAAARGVVAVSVEYDNFFLISCGGLRAKTRCVFDAIEPQSAVARLCALPNVDCSRGILVGGHSQGSQLALYAKNWDSRVRALWGLGATSDHVGSFGSGDQPGVSNATGTADDRCLRDDMTAIEPRAVRLVNGLNEVCYSTSSPPYDASQTNPSANCGPASSQGELQRMTGATCAPEAMGCLDAAGSGWLIVPNQAATGGSAHHTWFGPSTPDGGASYIDPGFGAPSTNPWSVITNVDWLKGFTGPAHALPVRIDCGAAAANDGAYSKDSRYLGGSAVNGSGAGVDALYLTSRQGAATYTFDGLPPGAPLTVKLHFAELQNSAAGQRRFVVDVGSSRVETGLDVFAEAGGAARPLVKTYATAADAQGRITVSISGGTAGQPMLAAVEVL